MRKIRIILSIIIIIIGLCMISISLLNIEVPKHISLIAAICIIIVGIFILIISKPKNH